MSPVMRVCRLAVTLVSLVLTGTACARILPATKQDGHSGRIARPRVEMTATRRREGSDVTVPARTDPGWLGSLIPCDIGDSAATKSRAEADCRRIHLDDALRAPIDTATRARP